MIASPNQPMKSSSRFLLSVSLCALALGATYSRGAAPATDNASDVAYPGSWTTGSNGGTGFNAWTLTPSGAAGFFVGNSALNAGGTSGNINTNPNNRAWGEFASGGGVSSAVRTFKSGGSNGLSILGTGEKFTLAMDNGFIDAGGTVGFGLQDSLGVNRFEFFFAGGQPSYTVSGSVDQATTHGFTGDGLTATFTLTGINTYSFAVAYNTGVPVTQTLTGTLKGTAGSGIDRFRLFNANAGTTSNNDAYFNSATVAPEPSTFALVAASALGFGFIRRRRS